MQVIVTVTYSDFSTKQGVFNTDEKIEVLTNWAKSKNKDFSIHIRLDERPKRGAIHDLQAVD